ncbi:hypothetical protein WMY93_016087 [Mugilogobius chulae]|uniref:Uncharacterized protein n=1 Tax=Mugilogobius chulae TaxID=88201 RepID=A0AAW0NSH2_9GOBI
MSSLVPRIADWMTIYLDEISPYGFKARGAGIVLLTFLGRMQQEKPEYLGIL